MLLRTDRIKLLLITFIILQSVNCNQLQDEQVGRWARQIGDELWKLGEATTKFKEIQGSYVYYNAQVETKNLEELLKEVVSDVERMMDRKGDAIKCIMQKAEQTAESVVYNKSELSYRSSKYSYVSNQDPSETEQPEWDDTTSYMNISVNADTHFYNLDVDTGSSSVHIPANIYDRYDDVAFTIQWSEHLDEIFRQNYKSDPALSWQYFGSVSGVMRHYPGKRWPNIDDDEFDCRVRTWYIEAATCTKDVVIVVDNTGSMDGVGQYIAFMIVNSILDTFSNNDFINVLYYNNNTVNYTVPCFKDLLVQATPENVQLFKDVVKGFLPSGKTNVILALETAFDILARYREKRGCSNYNVSEEPSDEEKNSKSCNQAIMLVTDGIASNLSEVVIRNNNLDGGSTIPVRLFVYLIGKEVTNVEELRWMSCTNRGYFTQVQTLEQVGSSVFHYINVIARPLVLQGKDHPVSWTHAYVDSTYNDSRDDQINVPYRLLISAAVPAFDKKVNQNNESTVANLLGVAGTDVPLDDIEKLTLPYKMGVNAYAFIVSNNGYVLMHRDFRPMFNKHLRRNYNSIDLVEIEQFDYDRPPRDFHEDLIHLRDTIVDGTNGSIRGIPIKYHYDDMRRVTKDNYDYYFSPLKATSFSLAFAVPDGYGHFSLNVTDEIRNDRHKPGAKITDYFVGSNWKIHPKWVYCKYHYLEGHEFQTPELELIHFLGKIYEKDFKWEKQYVTSAEEDLDEVDCGRKTHGDNDYYCDEQLVTRLVFDAKNTFAAFQGTSWQPETKRLFERFNVTLRFVATMSGLTRWEYISEEVENNTEEEFGDFHSRAIDETWYKSAVIQHRYDRESFVYSVPFDSDPGEEVLVTGSFAIFPSDAGKTAPGSVVGFQFAHKNLMEILQNITANHSNQCVDCGTCSTNLTCYLIDNNGYIVASEDVRDTGRFFGEIEGNVMESMLNLNIFEKVTIYDYQGICDRRDDNSNAATLILTPIEYLKMVFNWCIMRIAWLALEINIYNVWTPLYVYADDSDAEDEEENFYDCEKQLDLFVLKKEFVTKDYQEEIRALKTYYLKKVPHSNLLFISVNDTIARTKKIRYSTKPRKLLYGDSNDYSCKKLELGKLHRRRLSGCYNEHPKEHEIKVCSRSAVARISYMTSCVSLFVLYIIIM